MISGINANPELFSTLITFFLTTIMLCSRWSISAIITKVAQSKFIKNLRTYIQPLITQAEQMLSQLEKSGTTKKEYVMGMIKAKAISLKLEKVGANIEPVVSEVIDTIVAELNQFVKAVEE